jgi:AGCS family alanine or glycine:cation symporter
MAIFSTLRAIEDVAWLYVGIPILMMYGLYISYQSSFLQIFKFSEILGIFYSLVSSKETSERGIKPIHIFFASVGGCVGVGNVISVCSAVKIGGPGAVFWLWIAALLGMMVKYAEIFLSVKYRKNDGQLNYIGGPVVFFKELVGGKYLSKIVAILICLYSVEVYLFKVVSSSLSKNWDLNYSVVVFALLFLILGAAQGGLRAVGRLSGFIIPIFLVLFAGMSMWVFIQNWTALPGVFALIFKSAFSYHAAAGGFAGGSMWLAMSHGVRRACYTGDIGIGYTGIIHASTSEKNPAREAVSGVISIFIDTFIICTLSLLLILVTGVWNSGLNEEQMVVTALAQYFPHVDVIWPLFIFLLGYSTLISYFSAGRQSAREISKKYGPAVFSFLGSLIFITFSFVGSEEHCLTIMSLTGVLLLIINLYGMWKLSDAITYNIRSQ